MSTNRISRLASFGVAAALLLVLAPTARSTAQEASAAAQKRCPKGSVAAVIGGEQTCLKAGRPKECATAGVRRDPPARLGRHVHRSDKRDTTEDEDMRSRWIAVAAWLAQHPAPEDANTRWGGWIIEGADGDVVPLAKRFAAAANG